MTDFDYEKFVEAVAIKVEELIDYDKLGKVVADRIIEDRNRLTWSIPEASRYSGIGINRMRDLVFEGYDWVVWIADGKRRVKIEPFKAWLNKQKHIE